MPIVLATYPLVDEIEHGYMIFNIVFFIVIFSALLQGSTITPVAKWLGFEKDEGESPSHSTELLTLGQTKNDIYGIELPKNYAYEDVKIRDLDLSENIQIIAVLRENVLITPDGDTRMHSDDFIYVMMPRRLRKEAEEYFGRSKKSGMGK